MRPLLQVGDELPELSRPRAQNARQIRARSVCGLELHRGRYRQLCAVVSQRTMVQMLWPADSPLRLARFGVLTVGDLLRLPRGGLVRQIGHDRLAELNRAIGRHPDVRRYFAPQECYEDAAPLDFEIETTGHLNVIIEQRLRRLQTFLTRKNLPASGIV
jgi:hypothetical protein